MYGSVIINFKFGERQILSCVLKEFCKEQSELSCTNKTPGEKPSIDQFSLLRNKLIVNKI